MTKQITAMEVRQHLGEILNLVSYKQESFIINKSGKDVAAIIDMESFENFKKYQEEILMNAMLDSQNKFSHLNDQEIESLIEEGVSAIRKKRKS